MNVKWLLRSNRAINAIEGMSDGWLSGITGTIRAAQGKLHGPLAPGQKSLGRQGFGMDAIKQGFKAEEGQWDIGGYSVKKMAGSYMGISAAGRIATGGGVYKDRNGNVDIIGLPFI